MSDCQVGISFQVTNHMMALTDDPIFSYLQESFARAKNWVKELQRQASPNIVIALSGNKADLANKRAVDFQVRTNKPCLDCQSFLFRISWEYSSPLPRVILKVHMWRGTGIWLILLCVDRMPSPTQMTTAYFLWRLQQRHLWMWMRYLWLLVGNPWHFMHIFCQHTFQATLMYPISICFEAGWVRYALGWCWVRTFISC